MLKKDILKIKAWIRKSDVIDGILFGSSARGNINPKDFDLCILIDDSEEKNSLELIESLSLITDSLFEKYHINILKSSSFLSGNTLAKTLISEGYSLKQYKQFSEVFGFHSKSMFRYSLRHYTPSQRVRFHYLLNGRYGNIGILKETQGILVSNGVIVVPNSKEDLLKSVLDQWNVKYKITKTLSS